MGAQVRRAASGTNYPNIRALAVVGVNYIERVCFGVDTCDHLLPGLLPPGRWISQVGDMLVRALRVGFINAGDLNGGHGGLLFIFEHVGERLARAFTQGVQTHVRPDAGSELRAVRFPQGPDKRIPALLADFTVVIAGAAVETDGVMGTLLFHGYLISIFAESGTASG